MVFAAKEAAEKSIEWSARRSHLLGTQHSEEQGRPDEFTLGDSYSQVEVDYSLGKDFGGEDVIHSPPQEHRDLDLSEPESSVASNEEHYYNGHYSESDDSDRNDGEAVMDDYYANLEQEAINVAMHGWENAINQERENRKAKQIEFNAWWSEIEQNVAYSLKSYLPAYRATSGVVQNYICHELNCQKRTTQMICKFYSNTDFI